MLTFFLPTSLFSWWLLQQWEVGLIAITVGVKFLISSTKTRGRVMLDVRYSGSYCCIWDSWFNPIPVHAGNLLTNYLDNWFNQNLEFFFIGCILIESRYFFFFLSLKPAKLDHHLTHSGSNKNSWPRPTNISHGNSTHLWKKQPQHSQRIYR